MRCNVGLFIRAGVMRGRRAAASPCCSFIKVCFLSHVFPQSICQWGWYFLLKTSLYWLKPTQYFTPLSWWRVYHFREFVYNHSCWALCSAALFSTNSFFFIYIYSQRRDREPGNKHSALYKDIKSQASHLKFLFFVLVFDIAYLWHKPIQD